MTMSIAKIGTKILIKKKYQEEVLEELEEKAQKKSAIKAERKAQKAEKKEARRERRAEIFSSVKGKLVKKANKEPVSEEEGVIICYETPEKKGEIYEASEIEARQIVDSFGKQVPNLRGETLKDWNLEKNPLFVKDGKNTLEVIYTDRVYTNDESKAYILVETEYVYFVVEYEIKIKRKEVKTYQMVETF